MTSKRILVVDDDVAIASLYATAFRAAGHEVSIANRFEEARMHLRGNIPDGLLTDIRLGEYNGLQLAMLYRSLSPTGTIVIVSGHPDPVIEREAAALGAEFFTKPIDLEVLRKRFSAGPAA